MKHKHELEGGRWSNIDKVPLCEYCKYCTDTLADYTNGDYLWMCNKTGEIGMYDLNTGMLKVCPLKEKEKQDLLSLQKYIEELKK